MTFESPLTVGHRDGATSDCRVTLRRGRGVTVVRPNVEPPRGDAIVALVDDMRAAFGAVDVDVEIDDAGARVFVLAARLEAAFRAAGFEAGRDLRPERTFDPPPPSPRDRRRRTRLYVPGDAPRLMVSAGLHRPDGVIFDLEDGVHPDHKAAARWLVRNALRSVDFGDTERMVRVNRGDAGLEDLEAVVPEAVDVILIPKVEDPLTVVEVDRAVSALRRRAGLDRPVWLMPILESALGIEHAFAIARASERVVALTIGLEDYTADLGVTRTPTGEESLFARQRVVNAATAAGVQAIDSVYGDVADTDGLAAWCARSRALGFVGMGCVHPRQIEVIQRGFAPSPAEVEQARRIIEAAEAARAAGRSVVALGSKMIDPPVVKRALQLVAEAEAHGAVSRDES